MVVVVVVVTAPVVVRLTPSGAEVVAGAFAGADVVEAVVEIRGCFQGRNSKCLAAGAGCPRSGNHRA